MWNFNLKKTSHTHKTRMTLTQVMTYADLVIDEANNMIEHTVGVIFGG